MNPFRIRIQSHRVIPGPTRSYHFEDLEHARHLRRPAVLTMHQYNRLLQKLRHARMSLLKTPINPINQQTIHLTRKDGTNPLPHKAFAHPRQPSWTNPPFNQSTSKRPGPRSRFVKDYPTSNPSKHPCTHNHHPTTQVQNLTTKINKFGTVSWVLPQLTTENCFGMNPGG